jgi:hypothetical protein
MYQMHHIFRDAPWERSGRRLEILVQQARSFMRDRPLRGWHIAKANEAAKSRNFLGLVSEQSLYNLNARTVELE